MWFDNEMLAFEGGFDLVYDVGNKSYRSKQQENRYSDIRENEVFILVSNLAKWNFQLEGADFALR